MMPFGKAEPIKNSHRSIPLAFIIWVIFFCYAICAALLFQEVLLPLMPSLHAGGGLMSNDAVYFDSVAVKLAEQINLNGWSSWQLYPATGAAGNVAILGALYALFGHDPTLIVPVNAAIHALGGVLIFLLARELSTKDSIGTYAGVIAATLFVIFPSALNWYGQIHKDGYAIAGLLLILWTWVRAMRGYANIRSWLLLLLIHFIGVVLVAIVRPYNLKLLLIVTLLAWLLILVVAVFRRQFKNDLKLSLFMLLSAINLVVGIITTTTVASTTVAGEAQFGETYANWQGNGKWEWQDTPWLPNGIESYVEIVAKTRAGLIDYGLNEHAKSMIDEDIVPESVAGVLAYLPRALQVSMFAPFPSSWFASTSMARLVSVAETFVWYLCFPGVLLLLIYNRSRTVWFSIFFAVFFLLVHGVTIANLGTLYRLRYAYEFILLMMGVLGWLIWLDRTGRLKRLIDRMRPPVQPSPPIESLGEETSSARKEALGSGLWVMALTLLCFVGFFIRDVLMAQKLGLGGDLDNFYIALMIPMFIVAVLCMPLGSAFIPAYLEIKERVSKLAAKSLVTITSFWTVFVLLFICLALYLIGPFMFTVLYHRKINPDIGQLTLLFDIALPILLLSGTVILGNAVLNAYGRAVLTSAAQLVVPIVAIFSLLIFGKDYGVKAVMYGMVFGQLLNLLIVQLYLRQHDVSLRPTLTSLRLKQAELSQVAPLFWQYLPLMASAFFISIAAPVSTMLAMSLPEGAVSAFNLGNKVVLFVTGLVGTAVGAVLLPYFAVMVSKNHLVAARRELTLFLLIATFISVPISAVMYVWSEPIIRFAFQGGAFGSDETAIVTRVMQYGVVQLPFFVCNSLLLRFAIATKHVFAITAVAVVGLLVNVLASAILMKHMGVAGIALGMTVSMLVSTILLALVLVRYWHITWFDAVVMMMNWLLYITLLMGVHFHSTPSIFVTSLAYAVLLAGYSKSFSFQGLPRIRMRN